MLLVVGLPDQAIDCRLKLDVHDELVPDHARAVDDVDRRVAGNIPSLRDKPVRTAVAPRAPGDLPRLDRLPEIFYIRIGINAQQCEGSALVAADHVAQ